jgi:hypothetical protein
VHRRLRIVAPPVDNGYPLKIRVVVERDGKISTPWASPRPAGIIRRQKLAAHVDGQKCGD